MLYSKSNYIILLCVFLTIIIGVVIDSYGKYEIGDNPIVFDDLDCFGHEKTLLKCSWTVYPNFTCSDNNIVGLLCLESKFLCELCLWYYYDLIFGIYFVVECNYIVVFCNNFNSHFVIISTKTLVIILSLIIYKSNTELPQSQVYSNLIFIKPT